MRILLAVDGSDQSFEATKALQYLAPAEEVTVLHVLEGPPKAEPFMMSGAALDLYRTMERQFREDGEKVLDVRSDVVYGSDERRERCTRNSFLAYSHY